MANFNCYGITMIIVFAILHHITQSSVLHVEYLGLHLEKETIQTTARTCYYIVKKDHMVWSSNCYIWLNNRKWCCERIKIVVRDTRLYLFHLLCTIAVLLVNDLFSKMKILLVILMNIYKLYLSQNLCKQLFMCFIKRCFLKKKSYWLGAYSLRIYGACTCWLLLASSC